MCRSAAQEAPWDPRRLAGRRGGAARGTQHVPKSSGTSESPPRAWDVPRSSRGAVGAESRQGRGQAACPPSPPAVGWGRGRGRAVPPGPHWQHFPLTHPLGFPLPICLQLTAWGWVMMGDPATPSLPPSPFKPSAFRFSHYFSQAADTGVLRGSSQHRGVPPARAPPPQPPVPSWWYRAPPSPLRTGRGDLPNGAGGLGQHSWRCDGSGSCYGKRPPTRGKPTAQRGRSPHRGPAAPQLPPSLLLCPPAPSPLPAWVLAWGPASPRVPAPQVRLPWPLAQGGKQQQGGGGWHSLLGARAKPQCSVSPR